MGTVRFDVEPDNALFTLTVEGIITVSQMEELIEDTRVKARLLRGRPFGILVDLRNMGVSSPETSEKIKAHQSQLMKLGLRKSAEIVDSARTMLQLNRVAKESGMYEMLRRFTDETEARAWLAEP